MGPRWYFQVVSDAVLMDAWLSGAEKVWDPDVEYSRRASVSNRYAQVSDLVDPPKLLILQLGVKAARNKAMPEVLLEALNRRHLMEQKPTWIMDQPTYPLAAGHISYSDRIIELLAEWEHIDLEGGEVSPQPPSKEGVYTLSMGKDDGAWENQMSQVDPSAPKKKGRRW